MYLSDIISSQKVFFLLLNIKQDWVKWYQTPTLKKQQQMDDTNREGLDFLVAEQIMNHIIVWVQLNQVTFFLSGVHSLSMPAILSDQ